MSLTLIIDPKSSGMTEVKTQEEWARYWDSDVSGKYLPSLADYYAALKSLSVGLEHFLEDKLLRNTVDALQAAIKGLVIITGTRVGFDGDRAEIIHKYGTNEETRSIVEVPFYYDERVDILANPAKKDMDFLSELFDTEDSASEISRVIGYMLGRQEAVMPHCRTPGFNKTELLIPPREERQQGATRIGSLLYLPGEVPTLQVCLVHKPEVKGYSPLIHDLSIARVLQEQGADKEPFSF